MLLRAMKAEKCCSKLGTRAAICVFVNKIWNVEHPPNQKQITLELTFQLHFSFRIFQFFFEKIDCIYLNLSQEAAPTFP